jgi:glycine hydroxymethyltransferase
MTPRLDFLFRGGLTDLDPAVAHLIELENERQARKLIMIPSESSSPGAVREALGSVFMNLYAEGYPNPEARWLDEDEVLDYERHLAHYRRYGDERYYRGVEYADVVESLARRRCAEAFATDSISADQIYVNVQPLSGAPANVAIEQALLDPGDTMMGLSLPHGGHLTHGSSVNLSGRLYNVVSYQVNERTELLDYDQIEALALEHRPKLIIAGYTSYPRQPNWAKFRQIADRVGAYLLADIAHVAGMVVAGAYNSPLGYADVISFTTHKTLCGPRGACILTTDPQLAERVDHAVFPGLQGGPHVNKFAAIATAFRLAQTEQFRDLQHQIAANARALAQALANEGLRVPCGGTDTHLLLLDCKTVRGRDGTPLMGDPLATILDVVGIVVNKNTIPGDRSAAYPSGIRLGTPWVTQRGLREPDMEQIASVVARAMEAIEPYTYDYVSGLAYRGKITFEALQGLRLEVATLADRAAIDFPLPCSGYPHHCLVPEMRERKEAHSLVEIVGSVAAPFVEMLTPMDLGDLERGEWRDVALLDRKGALMSWALVQRPASGHNCYRVIVPAAAARRIIAWLRHLSDGHVLFDDLNLNAKLPGPVVVRDLGAAEAAAGTEGAAQHLARSERETFSPPVSTKPYYIGLSSEAYQEPTGTPLPPFDFSPYGGTVAGPLRTTPLYDWHVEHGAKMAPFAGWEMPRWYTSIGDEHRAVRGAAGLFDVSHMAIFEVSGPHAAYLLNLVATNDVATLRPVDFGPGESEPGESQYSFLLDPDGHVIDDLCVYRLGGSRHMLVVNAANAEKDWRWLQAVNAREVRIDQKRPWARSAFQAELRNTHGGQEDDAALGGLALQGPRSRDILLALVDGAGAPGVRAELRRRLLMLKRGEVVEAHIPSGRAPGGAFEVIIARTGYTGEPMAFELFVHPGGMETLWTVLLEIGAPFGLRAVGLGARDSLRIEAGLPLYGHELAGPLDLRPIDAGFQGYVKLHKPFFVGRQATVDHTVQRSMEVVRFRIQEKGVRMPKQGDAVADAHGRVIGQVTSCAQGTEGYLLGMAAVDRRHAQVGEILNVFPHPTGEDWDKPYDELQVGDRLVVHSEARVISRFGP